MFGVMTKLLAQLFQDLAKLPEAEQDAVAAIMLDELDAEARWSAVLGASQAALETLADEARSWNNCASSSVMMVAGLEFTSTTR